MCDGRLINFFVKLYVIADNLSVTMFARRLVPHDTNHVGCLKFIRYIYRRTSRWALGSVEVLCGFLAKAHLVLTRYVKFVLDAAF